MKKNRVEEIMEQVIDYLKDKPIEERYKHSLVMSNTIWDNLTEMEQIDLKNNIQIECNGKVIHNDYVPNEFVALVNSFLSVHNDDRVYKLKI